MDAKEVKEVVERLEVAASVLASHGAPVSANQVMLAADLVRRLAAEIDERPAPAHSSEPGVEACLAAINDAKHRGYDCWTVNATAWNRSLDHDELLGVGRLLIARNAAEEGGE